MINIAITISYLYPDAASLVDFELRDDSDGNGPYIHYWNSNKLGPQPTEQELAVAADSAALNAAKQARLIEVNAKCDTLMAQIRSGYPQDEVQSWAKQESEARAYLADSVAAVPLLAALAVARGIPLQELAQRVVLKADAFAVISGQVIGNRQRCEDEVLSALTVAQVEAVTWGA